MEQKTIIGINIPVIEETSEGQLRGGFTDLSMSPGDMMRTNMVCGNNDECDGNTGCFNNGECDKDTACFGNNPITTTTKDSNKPEPITPSGYSLY